MRHFKMRKVSRSLAVLLLSSLVLLLTACLGSRIGFQGQLTDPAGNPVPDGTYEITVRFYDSETGGTSIFTQTDTVQVENGLVNMDIEDFPPHIFSGEVSATEDTLFMEISIEGETLSPRRKVSGAAFAHALVPGSGIIGPRHDLDNVTDGGYGAALQVVNNQEPFNNPGFGISAQAANAGLYSDNLAGSGDNTFSPSVNPEDNPDIILGGEYLSDGSGSTSIDTFGGPGVLATDPDLSDSDLHFRSNDEIWLYKDYDDNDASEFRIYDGGTDDMQAVLSNNGDWSVDGTVTTGGADFAELIDVEGNEADYEPGDVLVISDDQDRAVELATSAYSSRVIGVYSALPGFVGGGPRPDERIAQEEALRQEDGLGPEAMISYKTSDGAVEVAIAGIVPVKVSLENGPIQRGDLLTTSNIPGHAMKATDPLPGTILGKAMGRLETETGVIEMLVLLQ